MDEAEVKVFSALVRLKNVLGEYIIEMEATDEEILTLVQCELDTIRGALYKKQLPPNAQLSSEIEKGSDETG